MKYYVNSLFAVIFIAVIIAANAKLLENHNHLLRNFVTPLENASVGSDSTTVVNELNRAIAYLVRNNMCDGTTSLFVYTTDEDLKIYYNGLVSAKKSITSKNLVLPSTIYNANGRFVVYPDGLSGYPHKYWFGFIKFIDCLALFILGVILFSM